MRLSRLQSLNSNIDHMRCSLSSKNSPRNTVDFEAACSVYIRFRGVNGYVATPKVIVQASDRRLSRKDNGNLVVVEDEENKALYLRCKDARVCISFTGVAYVQDVPTTHFIGSR